MLASIERFQQKYTEVPLQDEFPTSRPLLPGEQQPSRRTSPIWISPVLALLAGCFVGITLATILLYSQNRHTSGVPEVWRAPSRSPATYKLVSQHTTPPGGRIKTGHLRWYSDALKRKETIRVCQFENICIQHRSKQSDTMHYYLSSDKNDENSVPGRQSSQMMQHCLQTSKSLPAVYGTKDLSTYQEGVSNWINGTTFGFAKAEHGNHPSAWLSIWAAFSSVIPALGDSFLREIGISQGGFFDNYQLLGESFGLCGRSQFVMQTATRVARKALAAAAQGPESLPLPDKA